MSPRNKPPFRADHVGSLLRPKKLLQAREEHQAGRIGAAELRRVEDESIREIVRMQEDVGLQGITDGEHRRASWHMDFLYQMGGMSKAHDGMRVKFHNEKGDIVFAPAALRVTGKVKLDMTIFGTPGRLVSGRNGPRRPASPGRKPPAARPARATRT